MTIGPTGRRFPTGSPPRAAGRPMRITCGPTKCAASPTIITRSTAILIAFLSHERCRARMQTTGFSIATIRAGSQDLLLLRFDGLLMRDPAPQQIETVCRRQDAGKPIVRASRMPSGWPNDAVADRRGEGPVGDDGSATVFCSKRGEYT